MQMTRLNTNAHTDMPISPGGTHIHTRGMIPCKLVLSQIIQYTYKQYSKKTRWSVDTVCAHQSRSAAYTSGSLPCSLFKTAWLCWMYQLSNMQHVVVCWWWSSTSDWLRYTACPVLNTCSAKANAWMPPFFSARWCSLTRCLRLLQSGRCTRSSTPQKEWSTQLLVLVYRDWVLQTYQHLR